MNDTLESFRSACIAPFCSLEKELENHGAVVGQHALTLVDVTEGLLRSYFFAVFPAASIFASISFAGA